LATNDYHFLTHWRVPGHLADIDAVLTEPADYPRWWPEVFLDVEGPVFRAGVPIVRVFSKGRLPYTLRWQARLVEVWSPHGFSFVASGDFTGRGAWSLRQDGEEVAVAFDWKIRAEKPLLRWLSLLLGPVFAANHNWAMRRGEEGLRRELARLDRRKSLRLDSPSVKSHEEFCKC
jgi:hypothetical protein